MTPNVWALLVVAAFLLACAGMYLDVWLLCRRIEDEDERFEPYERDNDNEGEAA